jgi:hypothetical protein
MADLVGVLLVSFGVWRLLVGLQYLGVTATLIPDVRDAFWSRFPRMFNLELARWLDCVGGLAFVAIGVIALIRP